MRPGGLKFGADAGDDKLTRCEESSAWLRPKTLIEESIVTGETLYTIYLGIATVMLVGAAIYLYRM